MASPSRDLFAKQQSENSLNTGARNNFLTGERGAGGIPRVQRSLKIIKEGITGSLTWQTRRASQDVGGISKSTNSLPSTYQRSKSRSVDHGLAAPYDLDALRSKVDDRLNRDEKKVPTIPYTVGDRDSLRSIAARFDTTPSELTALNRLASSFVYPGQQLLVPDKSKVEESDVSSETSGDRSRKISSDDVPEEKDILDGLRPASPKPGHIERVSTQNPVQHNDDDPVTIQRFLKINVRHITDGQGVVGGVLLVTPNAVMFDPNVSDPLVIEHGPESYGVIAPMEFIVNAAIFNDIAHMRVSGEVTSNEKPEIYHPKSINRCETHSPGKDSLMKDETFPELGVGSVDVGDDQESVCSNNERDEGDAFPKAFERDLVTPNSASDSREKPTDLKEIKTAEERRKSLLDHHWAVPSKETENENVSQDEPTQIKTNEEAANVEADAGLTKQSCHDSGIDIRDANVAPVISKQKVYSDADIVLSKAWVPPLTIAPSQQPITKTTTTSAATSAQDAQQLMKLQNLELGRKKTHSVNFSVDEGEQNLVASGDKSSENKKNKMLKRLSHPLAWVEGLTGDGSNKSQDAESAPNTGDSNQSVFSKVFSSSPISLVSEFGGNLFLSKTPSEDSGGSPIPLTPQTQGQDSGGFGQAGRSSIGTLLQRSSESSQSSNKSQKTQPKLDYRSMVSIDDMPTLFVSFDQLIPRPARACLDPPMYIRLRMGRQMGKNTALSTTVMSYGKNKLRPEYWFSIPKNKVDELYRFLNSWVPHLYGELDEEAIKERGFELILNDTQWDDESGDPNKDGHCISDGEITEYTKESWELLKAPFINTYNKTYNIIKSQTGSNDLDVCEVLSMSADDYRKAALFTTGSFDQEFQVPDLVGQTEILTEEHREKLCGHLPARAEGYNWSLVFSTSLHGFSLNSLYRKMQKLESPILIVIQDTEHNVFGALTSCSLHVSDHFYGTGESLLYKFNPNFKVFHWSGENLYFIKGNPESLAIGAGDGRFGLWLDGDLNQGRSEHCSTYANDPLTTQEDFVIKTLECWAFV